MRRITPFTWFTSFLIALPLAVLWWFPGLLRCLFIEYDNSFVAVQSAGDQIYIHRQAPVRLKQQLLQHNQQASERIRQFWGRKKGQAILVYCHTMQQYAAYCGSGSAESSAGCSLGTPWGASYIVLGPEGNNADVIAHERCHDELLARVGWWTVRQQIPQWFNEGLALMVDYRFTNSQANSIERAQDYQAEWEYRAYGRQIDLELADIETMRDFFGGDYHYVMLAYYTGAAEVSRWLVKTGPRGPQELARRVGAGEDFAEVYNELKAKASRPNE